ncbi:MAG: adenylyltransferase/cytidyltransferase family protein [Patescibacteria group bacterium]
MSTCIFPGRFQPFHEGHLLVVQGMMKIHGNATIVICDGKSESGADHPFTIAERREMISSALLAADITEATIVDVPDRPTAGEWVDAVLDASGHPQEPLVWSGRDDIRAAFEEKKIATKKIVPVPGIDGAVLRQAIIDGKIDGVRSKIPAGAIDVVMEVINKRLR